jgi:hypothetical protein
VCLRLVGALLVEINDEMIVAETPPPPSPNSPTTTSSVASC